AGWWIGANVVGWGLLALTREGNGLDLFILFSIGFLPACTTALMLALLLKQVQRTGLEGALLGVHPIKLLLSNKKTSLESKRCSTPGTLTAGNLRVFGPCSELWQISVSKPVSPQLYAEGA
ncbi:MAG: hypothetical protein ACM3XO_03605, partial [Bacteroidota bacterium]